jgi:hypothetical protein
VSKSRTIRRGGVWHVHMLILVLMGLASPAPAQQPTSEQVSAIRQACRSDYQRHCSGVPAGGSAALACLQQASASLSAPCRQAVAAVGGPPTAAAPAGAAPTPQQAATANWPHALVYNGANVVVYQPQAISWPGKTMLTARAAVSIMPKGASKPILGTVETSGTTATDFNTRMVTIRDLALVSTHFPSLDTTAAASLEAKIRQAVAAMGPKLVPLDTVLLSLKEKPAPEGVKLNEEAPVIFYNSRLASLVVFDGEPVLAPAGKSGLSFAVNTNWDVFFDPATGSWYLLNNASWFVAGGYAGPWQPAPKLPPALAKLPNDKSFAEVRKNLPGKPAKPEAAPTIFVSTKPAEIILTVGPPALVAIPGTSLQYVTNTDSDLFLDTENGRFYYLVSGRWFSSSAGLGGPWSFATSDLPADFALIPEDGPRGNVLASVPGTAQAQQAVLEAQIPRQATLLRGAPGPQVVYAGEPQFKPIPDTSLTSAVNTGYEVIGVAGKYYLCYQGAWFVGASPTGPWILAQSIPAAIYTIPPTAPLYNVTYVQVYSSTPQAITYGYTAGYAMGFVSAGVMVYGTGYYYPPVVIPAAVPIYYPYPYSYAGGVWYNSATGAWARGGTVYGPYGAASAGTAYSPQTGAWAHGAAVYGPYGGAGAWSAYNPATGTYAHGSAVWGSGGGTAYGSFSNARYGISGSTTQNVDPYGRWGSSVISGPNQTIHTESGSNSRGSAGAFSSSTGAAGAGVHGSAGNNAGVVKGQGGDVYAGADRNVYRHTDSGWSKYHNGSWAPIQPPANTQNRGQSGSKLQSAAAGQTGLAGQQQRLTDQGRQTQGWLGQGANRGTYGQLQQDWQARGLGQQRQQQYQTWRNGGGALFRRR